MGVIVCPFCISGSEHCLLCGSFVSMDSLSRFFDAPSVAFLKACKKDELFDIADHFGITVAEKL